MKPTAAIPDALAVMPLVQGLGGDDSPFSLVRRAPALVARALAEETQNTKLGLITPIDYARHAGSYRIVPGIAVSGRTSGGATRVRVRQNARSIRTLAVDPRATSEIVLASILIAEKFPAADGSLHQLPTIVPVADSTADSLTSHDAVLEYHPWLGHGPDPVGFSFDLYEEWADLTDLPWVSAMWVVREEDAEETWAQALVSARDAGQMDLKRLASEAASAHHLSPTEALDHLHNSVYDLGEVQQDSLREFFQYAFYLGILKDVPEVVFFDPTEKEE